MKRILAFCMLMALFAVLSGCIVPTTVPSTNTTPEPSGTPFQPGTPTLPGVPTPLPTGSATFGITPPPGPTFTPFTGTPPAEPSMTIPVTPTEGPANATPSASTGEIPPTGGFTLDALKNFTYGVESPDIKVPLHDGAYTGDHINSRLVNPVAFGDLNGDGQTDAALVLATNLGGSGSFYDLIPVINQNGTPVQMGYSSVGDRQVVKNLTIENGRVVLDYLTQGPNDGLCCPSEHRLRSYILDGGVLRLASEQILTEREPSATPLPDAIFIDTPIQLSSLTNPVKVTGRVSQVPPEKKLEYAMREFTQAALVAHGEATIEGEVGGPGTFSFEIPLDSIPSGVYVLELVDSANGMLRGRSVVQLLGQ